MDVLAIVFKKTGVLPLTNLKCWAIVETGLCEVYAAAPKELFEFFECRHWLPCCTISRVEQRSNAGVFNYAAPVRGQLSQRGKFGASGNFSQFATLERRASKRLRDQPHLLSVWPCFT